MTMDIQNSYPLGSTGSASELAHLLGSQGRFNDIDYSSTQAVKPRLSAIPIEAVWVKNESGGALLPCEIPIWKTTGVGTSVGVKTSALSPGAGVVDPYLPAAGVANGEHFWLIRKGPAKVIQYGSAAWDAGDPLITGADGRVDEFDPTDADASENAARFGVAMADCVIAAGTKCRALVQFLN